MRESNSISVGNIDLKAQNSVVFVCHGIAFENKQNRKKNRYCTKYSELNVTHYSKHENDTLII